MHLDLVISITNEEVRYEILLSSDLVKALAPPPLGPNALILSGDEFRFVDPQQQRRIEKTLGELLYDLNPVTIDGVRVKPILERVTFVPAVDAAGRDRALDLPPDALVVLRYPAKGRPTQVSMVWDLFLLDPRSIRWSNRPEEELAAVIDAYGERKIITFTPGRPEWVWTAPDKPPAQRVPSVAVVMVPGTLAIPTVSIAILACSSAVLILLWRSGRPRWKRGAVILGLITAIGVAISTRHQAVAELPLLGSRRIKMPRKDEAAAILATLHRNVYRAFDYKSESDVYDVLARSVTDDLLDRVYNEVFEHLVSRDQGGAVARIKSVDIVETGEIIFGPSDEVEEAGFKAPVRWRVSGLICHWGHTHPRINEYRAVFTVASRDRAWKVTDVQMLSGERILSDTASGSDSLPSGKSATSP